MSMWSSENGTKVCGWMGYAVGDLRTSSGYGEVWIEVLVHVTWSVTARRQLSRCVGTLIRLQGS